MDMEESKAIDVQEKVEAEVYNGKYLPIRLSEILFSHTDIVQAKQTP
jgi:hypothetical protein